MWFELRVYIQLKAGRWEGDTVQTRRPCKQYDTRHLLLCELLHTWRAILQIIAVCTGILKALKDMPRLYNLKILIKVTILNWELLLKGNPPLVSKISDLKKTNTFKSPLCLAHCP